MMVKESTFTFPCSGQELVGVLHRPAQAQSTGVLIIVGGPQYRIGSHRQFILLARFLASKGIPVMRFDYRAMGDSDGNNVDFEQISIDMTTAADQFCLQMPPLQGIVLWGLCDAASAILQYGHTLSNIKGMVLLNPWVRTEQGQAKTFVKHYYAKRILQADMWKKVLNGQFSWKSSLTHFISALRKLVRHSDDQMGNDQPLAALPHRMLAGFERADIPALFVLSGANDFVAEEFRQVVADSKYWRAAMKRSNVQLQHIPAANHTFSSQQWRQEVEVFTLDFVTEVTNVRDNFFKPNNC